MILLLLLLVGCEVETRPPEPLNHRTTNRCRSKQSGSTPACWNAADWRAFCEHVECKNTPNPTTEETK